MTLEQSKVNTILKTYFYEVKTMFLSYSIFGNPVQNPKINPSKIASKEVVFINYFEVFSFLWGCATATPVSG